MGESCHHLLLNAESRGNLPEVDRSPGLPLLQSRVREEKPRDSGPPGRLLSLAVECVPSALVHGCGVKRGMAPACATPGRPQKEAPLLTRQTPTVSLSLQRSSPHLPRAQPGGPGATHVSPRSWDVEGASLAQKAAPPPPPPPLTSHPVAREAEEQSVRSWEGRDSVQEVGPRGDEHPTPPESAAEAKCRPNCLSAPDRVTKIMMSRLTVHGKGEANYLCPNC